MARINVTRSSMPKYEEYCQEIKALWETHWLTNMGAKHQELQHKLEEFLGIPYLSLFTNGHLALEGILSCLALEKGGEIITTPFTFASTTHAIARCGFNPVFCDVNISDYTIDVEKIESLISEKTVAIVPVHVYGNICDVDAIDRIAKKYHLKVVYDAAHAFGVKYKGISAVSFGDASILSFHATKVFNTIEGGAVCYSDELLTDQLHEIKDFGIHSEEEINSIGGNAKMSEFQAAMGLCNLRHINEEICKRRIIVERYHERLENINGIKMCEPQNDVQSNYAYLPVVFEGDNYIRDAIFERLKAHGIGARKYFYPLTNSFPCYHSCKGAGRSGTPIASYLADRVLTLPLYADLSLKDVDEICDVILERTL